MMSDDFPDVTDPREPDLPHWSDHIHIPNLAGVATADLVEKIGGGKFQASYINWSRTLNLLRTHAPGWMPELVPAANGGVLHEAPVGGFLLIRFRHVSGFTTPEVPQAIMDHSNKPVPLAKIDARDITDTHRRGVCMAAAMTFGLAYELWAKVALESGYGEAANESKPADPSAKVSPLDGAWEAMSEEAQEYLVKVAITAADIFQQACDENDGDKDAGGNAAHEYLEGLQLVNEEKMALWTRLDSKVRSALKRANEAAKAQKEEEE